jgi:hypothetical protein
MRMRVVVSPPSHAGCLAWGREKEVTVNRKRLAIVSAVVIAFAAVSGSLALAGGSGDDEQLTGSAKDRAAEAALAHTHGGTVVESEVGDDGAAYEVEVRLTDGSTVEVQLDSDFTVLGTEPGDDSSEGENENEGSDDD